MFFICDQWNIWWLYQCIWCWLPKSHLHVVLRTVLHQKPQTLPFLSVFHLSMLSISNCNLPLQMCQNLLRTSSAHQLARTLPSSHGTLPPLTVELPLKVPLKHAACNIHIWCLPPRRKEEFKFHFVYYIAIFFSNWLGAVFNDFTVCWSCFLEGTWWRGRR